ncbi:DNA polymerase IV [Capnocytophaga sp. ARDL2]|uniref:DNA polymerase IV n=1 Tax=Capnocytophaga sp. ARDL2 TaxID=3238809 RepID=UPI003556D7C7
MRKIIHIDMDAFYASVEQLDFPELRGKPIAVGGGEERGVVSAASYEARKYGVHSALSGKIAKKRCPELIFQPLRFERYTAISRQIRQIFYKYTDWVEPLSLDEAYLDVTENKINISSASKIARLIREEIFATTQLTASAGISVNKFLAKIASDYNKPNGQKTILPEEIDEFLAQLDVRKMYGIGKKTTQKMYQLGIFTGADLRTKSLDFLSKHFGNMGLHFYQIARGIHNSPVRNVHIPKSIGAERTFAVNLSSVLHLEEKLEHIANELTLRLHKKNVKGKTLTLKIKYSDFTLQTRSKTFAYYIDDAKIILKEAISLLDQEKLKDSVRLIGIQISNLNTSSNKEKPKYIQLKLEFENSNYFY